MKTDQNFKQKLKSCFSFVKEMYRVVMGTFLLSWIPHGCETCLLMDEITENKGINTVGQYANILTFLVIFSMYSIEMYREFKLIAYLEVNNSLASDNESVGERLKSIDVRRRNILWKWDKLYHNFFDLSVTSFVLNSGLSAYIIINHHGTVNKTLSVMFTNLMFFSLKLFNVYNVKKSDKNIFYSAYLTKKVQFNDVDPKKLLKRKSNRRDISIVEEI